MAVDECGRDEAAVEIDDVGVGKLGQADVVAAQPHDSAIADGHRGGVRHGRAVDPAAPQKRRQSQSGLRGGNACRLDVDDVDHLTVDVVAVAGGRLGGRRRPRRRP